AARPPAAIYSPSLHDALPIAARAERLQALEARAPFADEGAVLDASALDDAKLWVTARLLELRARAWPVFRDGAHEPLQAQGEAADRKSTRLNSSHVRSRMPSS